MRKRVFVLSTSLSLCPLLCVSVPPLELLWELSLLQLSHIKHWAVFFLLFWCFVSPLSVSCFSLGLHHQPSLLALSCLFPHMTYPDFPISSLPCPLTVHATLLSSLLLPIADFSDMIITSALLSSFSVSFSSPVPCFDLPLPAAYLLTAVFSLSHCVRSSLHLCSVRFTENVHSVIAIVQSHTICLTMSGNY